MQAEGADLDRKEWPTQPFLRRLSLSSLPGPGSSFALFLALTLASGPWLAPVAAQAQDAEDTAFRVVVHPGHGTKALPIPELSDVFFGKTHTWPDGREVIVVRRDGDDPVRQAFDRRIHDLPSPRVDQVWTRRLMTGRTARTEHAASDAEVLRIVASEPGAVGYVSADASLDGVAELPFVEMPERLVHRPPDYPPMAERARFYGVVVLRLSLDVEGRVDEIDVVEGQGMGLTKAAVSAVRQWRYAASEYRGRPVEVTFKVAVRFRI